MQLILWAWFSRWVRPRNKI